ncbi:MAG TPA: L-threonylcarbamoyladenylate synthase [Solirubrobacteraceae bacterium]|nr:L-threonylcarbamoyladenylate synthase [Solirubrobacteraceae bacterium]
MRSRAEPAPASLTAADARRLEACLAGDGVAVIPTDTVYGLACNPDSERALDRIYELKRRPPAKPAAVMFFALGAALSALIELGERELEAVEALLPGPVTLLLPNRRRRFLRACGSAATPADGGLLGLRIPELTGPLAALRDVRAPAAQSSANFSGSSDARAFLDVPSALREGVDLTLDGGELAGVASTIVDLSEYELAGRWRVLREGPLGRSAVRQRLGKAR